MNSKIITSICFKLSAIYLGINFLITIPSIFIMLGKQVSPSMAYLVAFTSIVITWLIVNRLWFVANNVINSFPETEASTVGIEESLYSVLGVFFIVSAASSYPAAVSHYINYLNEPRHYAHTQIIGLFAPSVKLIAGVILSIKARGLSNFLKKIRYAGT